MLFNIYCISSINTRVAIIFTPEIKDFCIQIMPPVLFEGAVLFLCKQLAANLPRFIIVNKCKNTVRYCTHLSQSSALSTRSNSVNHYHSTINLQTNIQNHTLFIAVLIYLNNKLPKMERIEKRGHY